MTMVLQPTPNHSLNNIDDLFQLILRSVLCCLHAVVPELQL
jgi:hypothetical protein